VTAGRFGDLRELQEQALLWERRRLEWRRFMLRMMAQAALILAAGALLWCWVWI
jgi:hypothetical protein